MAKTIKYHKSFTKADKDVFLRANAAIYFNAS